MSRASNVQSDNLEPCGIGLCIDNGRPGYPGTLHLTLHKKYIFLDIDERINSAVIVNDQGIRTRVRFDRFEVVE